MRDREINTADFYKMHPDFSAKRCPHCGECSIGIKKSPRKLFSRWVEVWAYCTGCGATGRRERYDFRMMNDEHWKHTPVEYAFLYWNQRIPAEFWE